MWAVLTSMRAGVDRARGGAKSKTLNTKRSARPGNRLRRLSVWRSRNASPSELIDPPTVEPGHDLPLSCRLQIQSSTGYTLS